MPNAGSDRDVAYPASGPSAMRLECSRGERPSRVTHRVPRAIVSIGPTQRSYFRETLGEKMVNAVSERRTPPLDICRDRRSTLVRKVYCRLMGSEQLIAVR
jgi:hypothetical protein